jgi:hypothetical protein
MLRGTMVIRGRSRGLKTLASSSAPFETRPTASSSRLSVLSVVADKHASVEAINAVAAGIAREAAEGVDFIVLQRLDLSALACVLAAVNRTVPFRIVGTDDHGDRVRVRNLSGETGPGTLWPVYVNADQVAETETWLSGAVAPSGGSARFNAILERALAAPDARWRARVAWDATPLSVDIAPSPARERSGFKPLRLTAVDLEAMLSAYRVALNDEECLRTGKGSVAVDPKAGTDSVAELIAAGRAFRSSTFARLREIRSTIAIGETMMPAKEVAGYGFRDALYDVLELAKQAGDDSRVLDTVTTAAAVPGGPESRRPKRTHRCFYLRRKWNFATPVDISVLRWPLPSESREAIGTRALRVTFEVAL